MRIEIFGILTIALLIALATIPQLGLIFLLVFFLVLAIIGLSSPFLIVNEFYKGKKKREAEDRAARVRLREVAANEDEARLREIRQAEEKTRLAKEMQRDADTQSKPYSYEIGRHALETLALRYGIPHTYRDEYGSITERSHIRVQKTEKLSGHKYRAILPEYRDREVIAIIEPGTEYVKTFYPQTGINWFNEHGKWEEALKGNRGFTVTEIAKMHFDRVHNRK